MGRDGVRVDRDEAFRDFAVGQSRGLRTLAYALTGDWHRADDLVQSALEPAYVHWGRVAAADDPGAYVRTILIRQVAAEGRRRWRSRESLTSDVPEPAADRHPGDGAEDRIDLAPRPRRAERKAARDPRAALPRGSIGRRSSGRPRDRRGHREAPELRRRCSPAVADDELFDRRVAGGAPCLKTGTTTATTRCSR